MRQNKINSTTGSEIVSTSDLKLYARIDTTADDALIAKMLVQARIWCENYISKDIVAKNRTYYIDESKSGMFDLPFAPVTSITSIHVDNVATTDFTVLGLDKETIELDNGPANNIKVVYVTSGIDNNLLQQAILQLAATYYDHRSDIFDGNSKIGVVEIPTSVKNILSSYRSMFI